MADSVEIWSKSNCLKYLNKPKDSDNKYRRGVLGCITGSRKYPGAALLTTSAAIATGVGMVRYFGPKSIAKLVIQNRPEVVIKYGKFDALLLGSGISVPNNQGSKIFIKFRIRKYLNSEVPKVLDAGSLFLSGSTLGPTIITPHAGELARLLNCNPAEVENEPIKFATMVATRYKVTVLLKGKYTIVTDGHRVIQLPAATSYLATAGTGDVLAGILGALIAINKEAISTKNLLEIGATASLIHASAAELSSSGPITPTEMIHKIASSINKLQN